MAFTGLRFIIASGFSPAVVVRSCEMPPSPYGIVKANPVPHQNRRLAVFTEKTSNGAAVATAVETKKSLTENLILEMERVEEKTEKQNQSLLELAEEEIKSRKKWKEYFEESKELIRSEDGGSPRWFSPLENGTCSDNSPLLLYLPGIDGIGLGLIRQHRSLGKLFDIWCLHIPVKDRTPFTDLVKLVERTVKSKHQRSPHRPIYLVGESLGACIALAVAALNPDIDLVLILANPGTSFKNSQLALLMPLLAAIPDELQLGLPNLLSSMTGGPLKPVVDNVLKSIPLQQLFGELFQDVTSLSSFLYGLSDMFQKETILWKLKLLESASEFANSNINSVNAQTLILSSGYGNLLPNQDEGRRLQQVLPKCELRQFSDKGPLLFMEDDFDLGSVIKGASFYRRGACHDYVSDYMRISPSEFKKIYESIGLIRDITSPVMLSTLEDGRVIRGLSGIPSEGPVLFLGYHMLYGFDVLQIVTQLLLERNILLRGLAHPSNFMRLKEGLLPPLSQFDGIRLLGAVPVSGNILYKLLSSKEHVLLYPGGIREVCHRKGEEYKLFWPEQPEFVRMAARFGTTIVPFGVVGEDDFLEVVFDYDDQMKVPFLRDYIKAIAEQTKSVRTEEHGEAGNQDMHLPGVVPKLPGRVYVYFGKPIETKGREKELKDKEKAQEFYLQVKTEVEKCIAFLKEKRKSDPYRNILARMVYQASHGHSSEIPTFEL